MRELSFLHLILLLGINLPSSLTLSYDIYDNTRMMNKIYPTFVLTKSPGSELLDFIRWVRDRSVRTLTDRCSLAITFWKGNNIGCAAVAVKTCILEDVGYYTFSETCLNAIRTYYPGNYNFENAVRQLRDSGRIAELGGTDVSDKVETRGYHLFARMLALKVRAWDHGTTIQQHLRSTNRNFDNFAKNQFKSEATVKFLRIGPDPVINLLFGGGGDGNSDGDLAKRDGFIEMLSSDEDEQDMDDSSLNTTVSMGKRSLIPTPRIDYDGCDLTTASVNRDMGILCLAKATIITNIDEKRQFFSTVYSRSIYSGVGATCPKWLKRPESWDCQDAVVRVCNTPDRFKAYYCSFADFSRTTVFQQYAPS